MGIWSLIENNIEKYGDSVAFSNVNEKPLTYNALMLVVGQYSNALNRLSFMNNRLVVIVDNPYTESILVLTGLRVGFTIVPVSRKYGEKLLERIIVLADPGMIVTDNNDEFNYYKSLGFCVSSINEIERLSEEEIVSNISFSSQIPKNEALAFIMFTSGTTGEPKGVMLSHDNITSNIKAIESYLSSSPGDKLLICRPLFHVAVMTGELLYGLYRGLEISFYYQAFEPRKLMRYIIEHEINIIGATPTVFGYLSDLVLRNNNPNKIKTIIISGERLMEETAVKINAAFYNVLKYHSYGLTEASPRIAFLEPALFDTKLCSIGKPLNGIECRLTVIDDNAVPNIGELEVRGPNIMIGYWRSDDLTKDKLINGWLHTGDLAYFDNDGYLFIVGRKDDMIIRAGVNIYPQEIEEELLKIEGIDDVMVYGVDDLKYGQRICANVVIKPNITTDILYTFICEAVPEYKRPLEINIVSEIHKNSAGKKIRKILKE